MSDNKIILEVGEPHLDRVQHYKWGFIIQIHNSRDEKEFPNANSEDDPSYFESDQLLLILENIRTNLLQNKIKNVDIIIERNGGE
jgi:hypothetical protein